MFFKLFLFALIGFLPIVTLAGGTGASFTPLVGIPGLEDQTNFNGYINALYALSISIAALIAVIQIVVGGAQYMLSDLITNKSAAKERITNAILGLLIIIGAWVILNTVNSDLTDLAINASPVVADDTWKRVGIADNNALIDYCNQVNCAQDRCSDLPGKSELDCKTVCEDLPSGQVFRRSLGNEVKAVCAYNPTEAESCNPDTNTYCCTRIKGGLYNTQHNKCVSDELQRLQITCVTGSTGGSGSFGLPIYNCAGAQSACKRLLGAEISRATSSIICDTATSTKVQVANTLNTQFCPQGETCEVSACTTDAGSYCEIGDDVFTISKPGACANVNGIFDQETEACIIPSIGDTSKLQINRTQTYKIDDPAIADLPAGEFHNKTITFPMPLEVRGEFNNIVKVLVDGQEVWVGCGLVTPSICNAS